MRYLVLIAGAAWALSSCAPPTYDDTPLTAEQLVEVRRASPELANLERDAVIGETLVSANKLWTAQFARFNDRFKPARAVVYNGGTTSDCRPMPDVDSQTFCPADLRIYTSDWSWQDLDQEFGRSSKIAHGVVIAHEVGHVVQAQTGVYNKVKNAIVNTSSPVQQGRLQAKLEQQADCYAGMWFRTQPEASDPDLVDDALRSRYITGDDYGQMQANGWVDADQISHGTSEQRVAAFRKGMARGDPDDCEFEM